MYRISFVDGLLCFLVREHMYKNQFVYCTPEKVTKIFFSTWQDKGDNMATKLGIRTLGGP